MDKTQESNLGSASSGKEEKLNKRIEFKNGVPEILYKRAGLRCSVPRCKNPTFGPFSELQSAVNMGAACHIYSAAENGPRGRGGKNAEFISSAENGIWCCQYHAGLIDKARGRDYPAGVLFAWKRLAEARTLKQMNDIPSPLGWVDSIEFLEFANRSNLPKMTLSRRTLMFGGNGSGKTVLLEAAASISQSKYSERISRTRIKNRDGELAPAVFKAKVTYSTVDYFSKELSLLVQEGTLIRFEGGLPCFLPPGDLEVIYCSGRDLERRDGEDDLDLFARVLNVDKSALLSLVRMGTNTVMPGETRFEPAYEEDEEGVRKPIFKNNGNPYLKLAFKKAPRDVFVSFADLSSSEQGRLIVDFLIAKAREVCKQRLTLLMIEGMILTFDAANFENLLTKLTDEEFQVIVSLPPIREKDVIRAEGEGVALQEKEYLGAWKLVKIDSLDSIEKKVYDRNADRVPCPVCKNVDNYECNACRGSGYMTRGQAASIDLGAYDVVDCPLCKGRGIYKEKQCVECDGNRTMTKIYADKVDVYRYKLVDCPMCRGIGASNTKDCLGCDGEKVVERYRADEFNRS